MYEDLVKSLRACGTEDGVVRCVDCHEDVVPGYSCSNALMRKAADAIEELAEDPERSKEWESFWEKEANEALRKFHLAVANNRRCWIPTKERLPEHGGEYIVYLHACDDGTMDDWGYTTAMYFDKGQSLWTCNDTSYNAVLSAVDTGTEYHITHWQPLPTPPKEET